MQKKDDSGFIGAVRNLIQKGTRFLAVTDEPQARQHAVRMLDAALDETQEYTRSELEDK
jgi:hypothetical protein